MICPYFAYLAVPLPSQSHLLNKAKLRPTKAHLFPISRVFGADGGVLTLKFPASRSEGPTR
jgi:hypothetical protein